MEASTGEKVLGFIGILGGIIAIHYGIGFISTKAAVEDSLIPIIVNAEGWLLLSLGLGMIAHFGKVFIAHKTTPQTIVIAEQESERERAEAEQKKEQGTALLKGTPSVGDLVSFGLYEQDGNTGNDKEVITWHVLAVEGSRVLLISEYAIDCQPFNSSRSKGNDWETSDLKAWLEREFLPGAFSDDERSRIREITCLSVDEVKQYFSGDKDRICYSTAYAKAQGAWTSSSGVCIWWLRSPGGDGSELAAFVHRDGGVYSYGNYVDNDRSAVRPALWLTL